MGIKCIVFDMGGVLFVPPSIDIWPAKVKEKYGIPENVSKDIFRNGFVYWETDSWTEDEFFSFVAGKLKTPDKGFLRDALYSIEDNTNKELMGLIDSLKKRYRIVCLTNHSREWFDRQEKEFGLRAVFHKIFTSFELKMSKPDEKIFVKMLEELGLEPEEVLFIDDKKENTKAAEKLGMRSITYADNESLMHKLKGMNII